MGNNDNTIHRTMELEPSEKVVYGVVLTYDSAKRSLVYRTQQATGHLSEPHTVGYMLAELDGLFSRFIDDLKRIDRKYSPGKDTLKSPMSLDTLLTENIADT